MLFRSGSVLRESLVIPRYLDALFPEPLLAHPAPLRHAQECLVAAHERDFGYRPLMNQDLARRGALCDARFDQYGGSTLRWPATAREEPG